MSGICGLVGDHPDKETVSKMLGLIRHRGPDREGIFQDKTACVASCKQKLFKNKCDEPFGFNENGDIAVAFDGLIYNYSELISELEAKNHKIKSGEDSEIIAHIYEEHHENPGNGIEGEFAFVIWDVNKKKLLIGTDKFGSKPFYYSMFKNNLIFSSEMKSILVFPELERKINFNGVYNHLLFRFIPGNSTPFDNIKAVPPASLLTFERGVLKVENCWKFGSKKTDLTENGIIKHYLGLMKRSVKIRMDKNAGAGWNISMSGGLDSSGIAAMSTEFLDPQAVHAYSFGLNEYDEDLVYARMVADRSKIDYHELLIDAKKDFGIIPLAVWGSEMTSDIAATSFRRMMYEKIDKRKIVSGLGAEEAFLDKKYLAVEMVRNVSRVVPFYLRRKFGVLKKLPLPYEVRQGIEGFNSRSLPEACARMGSFFHESRLRPLCAVTGTVSFDEPESNDFHAAHREFLKMLSQRYLWGADTQFMANAQQMVHPFLDSNLLNFAFSVPVKLGIIGPEKGILRACMKDILPQQLLRRDKRWENIIVYRLIQELSRENMDAMNERVLKLSKRPQFKAIPTERLNPYERLVLFSLEMWYEIFVDPDKISGGTAKKVLSH